MLEEQDKKRAAEWAAREQRIQNAIGRMAETVGKKNQEKQRQEDLRYLQQEKEKDRKAEEKEKEKKDKAFQRETEVRQALAVQMEEKRKQREDEQNENKKFVQMVIDTDNRHKQEQADMVKQQ